MLSPGTHAPYHEATTTTTNVSLPEASGDQSHHEMQDDVAYLSLSAMAERTDSQVLSAEGLSYSSMLYAATEVSGSDLTLPINTNEALSGPLAELRQSRLPDVDLASTELSAAYRCYVEMICQTFPYMTAAELTECHDSMTMRHGNDDGPQPLPEHLAIVYLGTATGLLLGMHYTYKEMLATEFALRAVRLMPKILDHAGNLSAIRSLIALVIFSMYTTFGGSTWHLLGLAMTRCISAGLHTIRLSDHRSQNNEQRAGSSLLWTLYILDTYVSTSLGRPFSLNDQDIMVSPPTSPPSGVNDTNVEEATLRCLIQHAQMIRSIRQSIKPDDGILCHYINIRHWAETIPPQIRIPRDHIVSLCSKAYVQLLQSERFLHDLDRASILKQVMGVFDSYLEKVEEQLSNPQSGAIAGLEALHIFAIGVILATRPDLQNVRDPQQNANVQTIISQVQIGLTLLSTRYSVVRTYRDIVLELQRININSSSVEKLRSLVAVSELSVPIQLQNLILGFASSIEA
ncbi:uncharacterized protein N0V89_005858 [Didymosphaeria variabile]|uniref:Xylanolytic transcriptional activator regulatory domain-containing protein n=1 Tax=Didymosphaeria variabile TaxID=1932322 RepID=A0A9W9CBN8_9PLEO|nr:uncharacterized protein N0V89_005858 [Didymosphaeria variabile]KAJ4354125.1 hypothetical protein N0V89_005858 [Didymosphaeria variabile]